MDNELWKKANSRSVKGIVLSGTNDIGNNYVIYVTNPRW